MLVLSSCSPVGGCRWLLPRNLEHSCAHVVVSCWCLVLVLVQLVSSDVVSPFGIDSIRVDGGFMFVGMSREDEGIVKVYNLAAGGASHQLTGHKVGRLWGTARARSRAGGASSTAKSRASSRARPGAGSRAGSKVKSKARSRARQEGRDAW